MDGLWQRVYAHPDDEEARRVLADALLESGDPRGELIEVQCALARVPEDERGPEEQLLVERERALLDAHGEEWVRGWPFELRPVFVRGFPERQHARAAELVRGAERAFRIAPTLREVVFTDEDPRDWSGGFNAFCFSPHAARLRRLSLPITFQPGDLAALTTLSPKALTFLGGVLGDVEGLARLPLEELRFEFDVGLRGLDALAALPLRTFVNRRNEVPAMPAWPTLQSLTLAEVGTRVEPLRWPRLRELRLIGMKLGRRGLRALLEPGHPAVRRLDLCDDHVDFDLAPLLVRWPALEVLSLRGTTFSNGAQRVICESPVLQRLRRLLSPTSGEGGRERLK